MKRLKAICKNDEANRDSLNKPIFHIYNENFLLKLLKISVLVCLLIGISNSAKANMNFIIESNITITPHISDGYIELRIPMYNISGLDENLLRSSYFNVNGNRCLTFHSSNSTGDEDTWQDAYEAGGNDYYRIWAERGAGAVKVFTVGAYTNNTSNISNTDFNIRYFEMINDEVYATFKVYLSESLLGKDLTYILQLNPDKNEDGQGSLDNDFQVTGSINGVSYAIPTISEDFSNTVGKFDVSFSVSSAETGSKYIWDTDNVASATVGNSATTEFDIDDAPQEHTLYFYHKVSDYQNYKVTEDVTLPAYQQVSSFTATNQFDGDTKLEWEIPSATTPRLDADQFEVERADNSGFSGAVTVCEIDFDPAILLYSYVDETSSENLNGEYWYRIRRTKTATQWGWDLSEETSVSISMQHYYISDANVVLLPDNIAKITWDYTSANIWSEGSSVIIERYNITSGTTKEVITVPADSMPDQSYSEELFQMCNEFTYKIYVKPGNTNYLTQDAINVEGSNIVPIETGNILSAKASKGYFSERTEISWETDGLPIDNFTVKSRIYDSGLEFEQIDQVMGAPGSSFYQYNDMQSNPGEIYEYQIIGIVQCAGVTTSTDTLYAYGFRTPTGDIYGRVTFENGQAEENVEVRLESEDGVMGKSMELTTAQFATIDSNSFLETNTDSITIQAWISPDAVSGTQKIFSKSGMYELGIEDNYFYFKNGSQSLNSSSTVSSFQLASNFVHITAVSSDSQLAIYINGQPNSAVNKTDTITGNNNQAILGDSYSGIIDEVRIWDRPLTANEISRDFNRYLTGGEDGLIAYWSFNYATSSAFYDRSYSGSVYNENDGSLNDATLSQDRIPTNEQLGYKGVTDSDGSYEIRAIPYVGNGTVYTIIPRLGIHTFESQEEVRFIGEGSQSHTVNFIDKSSFKVTGTITYEGGTIPVEGVSFTIDGIVAVRGNGTVIMTDAIGEFEIQVPVGIHEVIATKANHTFDNDGRITNSEGIDLNYQDEVLGLKLTDITTVKYIGRVAGGAIQDAYPLGFSLSKNNLADGISVTLTYKNPAYKISSTDRSEIFEHLIPSNEGGNEWPKTNEVIYGSEAISIFPNEETGEFIAEVIPESYTISVNVPGHDDVPGSGEDLNLTQRLVLNNRIHTYVDSVKNGNQWDKTTYNDTVYYHAQQKFIKRYSPTVRISQVDMSNNILDYYGETEYVVKTLGNDDFIIDLYPGGNYLLGSPVFVQNNFYDFKAEVFEQYVYCALDGNPKTDVAADEVPTQDATIEFNNNLSISGISQVEADSLGVASYRFQTTYPELTSGIRAISAKIYYGNDDNRTSINWDGAFTGIILGAIQTGYDFVTGGPDKVLMVLRDPPGSNSYSYLEKGISIKESSKYTGSASNAGSESLTQDYGTEIITWTGVGAGTINRATTTADAVIGIVHEENIGGSNSSESTTTTTTRFQTSSDPLYVGADADVFVGYSTNIVYGSTENVSIIQRSAYQANTSKYEVYTAITPITSDWLLVRQTGLGLAQTFGTLFAFPQKHIEDRLLPEMEALRNNFLMQEEEADMQTLQQLAIQMDTVFYVSHLAPDDPNFGKSNSDTLAFNVNNDPDPDNPFVGESYTVIFPIRPDFTQSDTILFLNQSMENWRKQLAANEEAKVNATLLQNYSFEGGSPVTYAESLSATKSNTTSFDIMIGGNCGANTGVEVFGAGFQFKFNETFTTTHGGEFTDAETESHCKGFELNDNYGNYLSVDVMYEDAELHLDTLDANESFYPTFVFRTRAGATSCPYEGENVTKYFEPGQHIIDEATKRIEVPEIAVENDFVENVPSGGVAYFTLYLRNNSEIKRDNWVTLKVVEDSNPNGAKLSIDGGSIGNGKDFIIPADGTLVKTLEVAKGSVLNYDNLRLVMESQCERTISDTVTFTVHFTPSCSEVEIEKPSDKWTYNTKLPTLTIDGVDKHYMDVIITGFDVNYDSFNRIKLQYKSAAESDDAWKTFMNYYADSALFQKALDDGWNAAFIDPNNGGDIKYILKMDDLPDQRYDLRAVSVCMINNEEIETFSETHSGIKDMLCPRLFGSPQPANGILTIEDDIRLNFNEQIAEGLLTKNNFQVTGIRNGAKTDHSVSISLDGINDFMASEFDKNMADKDIAVEMWIKSDEPQNATLFSHGNINESLELAITEDNHLKLTLGNNIVTSQNTFAFESGSWAHVALVYNKEGTISAYYNFIEVISGAEIGLYGGIGNFVLGRDISNNANFFKGLMHNVRVWNKLLSSGEIQVNSLSKLSGNEPGLLAYYPMTEAKGILALDKARGANLIMNGCSWSIPAGKAISLNGTDSYLKINTGGSAVIKKSMDYTIEFWFKADENQVNATMLSNGRGDGLDHDGSQDLFSIGFDENGKLYFANNAFVSTLENNYLDNNWHHFAVNVSRNIGRGQIYVDGNLINYFDSQDIGGIASAYVYIGARAWYAQNATTDLIIDNYFKGNVDELRIWNLYKNEQLIQQTNNVKLDGEEMGLLAYYPFQYYKEYQGINELDFTLADMKIQRDIANVVPDAENINATETSDIPPVKDKGPVSDLEFDFVVNNDALIIYLEESWEKIEKTIVTFTVDDIQDANGNENISPITWSAYIDRNQLKWGETSLNISKPINEPLEFSVKVFNNGGSIQHYNIENMPSWMEINPMSGSINPSSSIDIEFIIDEGLNVGTYNEVVYLINDNNVSEALEININVMGEKPDWIVNPSEFEYDMAIFGKMRFNNIFSSDEGDMLAAFIDGKCVGVTTSTYIRDLDMWYALLTVYNNRDQSDDIEFRMWDASTGITYLADPGRDIEFINDAVVGTPNDLVIFDAKQVIYQNISLVPGWNWISFNVRTDVLNDLNETLNDMTWTSDDYFKSESDSKSANYSVAEDKWIVEGTSLSLNNLNMYKLSSSVNQTLSLSGEVISPSTVSILVKGNLWNYISYIPNIRLTLTEALAGYDAKAEDVIKSQDGFAMYSDNIGWLGSLPYLEPNKGYMLYRNDVNNTYFEYPENTGSRGLKNEMNYKAERDYVNNKYSGNMNLIAVSDIKPEPTDRILAYVENELISETKLSNVNGKKLFFITVLGEDNMPISYAFERGGQIIGTTIQSYPFSVNSVSGTITNPVVLNFLKVETKLNTYPNPTNDFVTVSFKTSATSDIEINIVDVFGRVIISQTDKMVFEGLYENKIDCSRLAPGIYLLKVRINGAPFIRKIEIQ